MDSLRSLPDQAARIALRQTWVDPAAIAIRAARRLVPTSWGLSFFVVAGVDYLIGLPNG